MIARANETARRRVRRAIIAVGIFVLAAGGFGGWLRTYNKRARAADLAGIRAQTGVASVETLVIREGSAIGIQDTSPWALVRFRGGLHRVTEIVDPGHLREWQPATITFRVGKSGRIYVDRLEPLLDRGSDMPAGGR